MSYRFKKGDKVKVVKKVPSHHKDWNAAWVHEMDKCVGKEGVVGQPHHGGYTVRFQTTGYATEEWNFHEDSLESASEPVAEEPAVSEASLNPKALIGSKALPLTAASPFLALYACLGKANGAGKYGVSNFIGTKVVMSIYMDAIQRHFDKLRAGEWADAVDNVPHWSAILANIDIILSAKHAGTLIDDRPMISTKGYQEAIAELTPLVASLQELHKDREPKHYYLKDAE